jgi:hypothetical protein
VFLNIFRLCEEVSRLVPGPNSVYHILESKEDWNQKKAGTKRRPKPKEGRAREVFEK